MAIQKPAPLMIGNKAYYTLTSYDPVEVEVIVPFITDEEVELALGSLLEDEGGTVENLSDPDWIAKHFEGLRSTDELHRVLRARLREMNAQFAEDQKRDKCMVALAERLGQSVPPEHVAAVRAGIYANFKQRAASECHGQGRCRNAEPHERRAPGDAGHRHGFHSLFAVRRGD